jgi:alpha-L-fucosidase
MPRIATMARKAQPGLLIVDRTVHGRFENYQTPEQRIPQKQLDHPWESCMTLANNWGYVANDNYKSAAKVIHTLIEVVAKGGSLLLGVGPKPDGTFTDEAVTRLKEVGKWINKNGVAIYNTRTTKNYHDGNTWFTQNLKTGLHYALVCLSGDQPAPKELTWQFNVPKKGSRIIFVETGKPVKWQQEGDRVRIFLPSSAINNKENAAALVFSFILTGQ